jgi:hypothetical protein
MFSWLNSLQDWFRPTAPDSTLKAGITLPEEVRATLTYEIQHIESPQPHLEAMQQGLAQALQQWQNQRTLNSFVILASPLEITSRLLKDGLRCQPPEFPVIYFPHIRPEHYQEIPQKLTNVITQAEERSIIVIPHLTACFLRCIGGLEGIVLLRDTVVENTEHFWLIGCNYWAWQYLDYICHTHACFERTLTLSKLSETELAEWLQPLVEKEFLPELDTDYFQQLRDNSLGVGRVATYLWLQSLRLETEQIIALSPKLPSLPDLPWRDRYLLYSLLLHERMTLKELAVSLGENDHVMRSYVQELRLSGLIQGDFSALELNPVYYPQLRLELAQNNFLITGDN